LTVSQAQGNIGLASMSDPKYLGLAINQAQGNVGLVNMSDPKNLNITKF
jgi:hypothetical protein